MSVKLKISVTKEILERSKYCDKECSVSELRNKVITNCAIALAVRDIWPKAKVENDCIIPFGKEGRISEIELPEKATKFIEKFDVSTPSGRVRMKPFDFEVSVPAYVIRKVNIEELRPLLQNHPTLELIPST